MVRHRWQRLDKWDERSDERISQQMDIALWLRKNFQIRNRLVANAISEFFCTALLLLIGTGISLQFALKGGLLNNFSQTILAWSFAVTISVYSTLYTSGAHMNPAISVAFFTLGKLPLKWLLAYIPAQIVGAFFGTALSFHIYSDEFDKFTGGARVVSGPNATALIFTTFPAEHISHYTGFLDQLVATALLMIVVTIATEPRNNIPPVLLPLLIGMTIFMLASGYATNVGCPMNPARDLGPRLFLLFAGYGWEVFSWHGYYFWIPLFAPTIGAPIGALTYYLFVGIHIPDPQPPALLQNSLIKNSQKQTEFDPLNPEE